MSPTTHAPEETETKAVEGLIISDALARCLEHAKKNERYGVRPVGFKGIVYCWESRNGTVWQLYHANAGVEGPDDTYILGPFEVLPSKQITDEWPI